MFRKLQNVMKLAQEWNDFENYWEHRFYTPDPFPDIK
jgi:hypothetical protein